MKGEDPLAPWLQLQALYAQQLGELSRARPDLALLSTLAARAEQLLMPPTRPQQPRPGAAPERSPVTGAAPAPAAMLARAQALLERLRGQRSLEHARQRERATRAALLYRDQGAGSAPRFLDLRR